MNILLLEDDEDLQYLIKTVLEPEHRVVAYGQAIEAMHPSRFEGIDRLVVDLMMPFTSGVTAIRWARRWAKGIPIILLTAMPKEQIKEVLAMVDGYIPKPFQPEELVAALGMG